jgi:DNA-binding HxlR family transcriptional regulator
MDIFDTIGTEMLPRTSVTPCPVMTFQKLISGKYKARILWDLREGALRYGGIRRGLLRGTEAGREIAPRVLSRELKSLVANDLIQRRDFGVVPPKVEYSLTARGRSFIPVIAAIRRWSHQHLRGETASVDNQNRPVVDT